MKVGRVSWNRQWRGMEGLSLSMQGLMLPYYLFPPQRLEIHHSFLTWWQWNNCYKMIQYLKFWILEKSFTNNPLYTCSQFTIKRLLLWERWREEYLPDSLTSTYTYVPIYIYKLIFSTKINGKKCLEDDQNWTQNLISTIIMGREIIKIHR